MQVTRTKYMKDYYRRNRARLLPKAKKRYRDRVTAKYKTI